MTENEDRESVAKQLALWVEGESVHNDVRDECTPDFSCCTPALLQPRAVREAFAAAAEGDRMNMLGKFMGELLRHEGVETSGEDDS